MKEIENKKFDKLDKKIFDEMPFLVDTISAFGNKVANIFDPIYDKVETIIKNSIKNKKSWQIKFDKKNVFYPFTLTEYSTQTKITKLEGRFILENHFEIAKFIRGKQKNYVIIEFGYWLQTKEDENHPEMNVFYFSSWKGENYEKYGGIIKDADFYKSIKHKNRDKNFDFDISHPDLDGEPESIEIRCSKLDSKKIDLMYKIFRDQILMPILKSLK
jgi:hypothetical protein